MHTYVYQMVWPSHLSCSTTIRPLPLRAVIFDFVHLNVTTLWPHKWINEPMNKCLFNACLITSVDVPNYTNPCDKLIQTLKVHLLFKFQLQLSAAASYRLWVESSKCQTSELFCCMYCFPLTPFGSSILGFRKWWQCAVGVPFDCIVTAGARWGRNDRVMRLQLWICPEEGAVCPAACQPVLTTVRLSTMPAHL